MEYLDSEMRTHGVDKVVITTSYGHYGNDNRYTIHCVKSDPRKFVGIGLLVRAHALTDLPTVSCVLSSLPALPHAALLGRLLGLPTC